MNDKKPVKNVRKHEVAEKVGTKHKATSKLYKKQKSHKIKPILKQMLGLIATLASQQKPPQSKKKPL